MTVPTDTEVREIRDSLARLEALMVSNNTAVTQQLSALTQRVEVGFAEVRGDIKALDQKVSDMDNRLRSQEIKLNQLDVKQGEMNVQLAEMRGDLKIVKQPIEFWEFVKRAVVSGMTVTVVGGCCWLGGSWRFLAKSSHCLRSPTYQQPLTRVLPRRRPKPGRAP
jgi:phosphatidate phosphatase PAH1